MGRKRLVDSFNDAIEGIIYTVKSQRSMRLHFLIGLLVILLTVALGLGKIETIFITLSIALVLITEMLNTAIEKMMDIVTPEFHPLGRIIKDIVAGCVLLASLTAVVVGYIIFSKYLINFSFKMLLLKAKHSPWHITFLALLVVVFTVILGKALSKRGRPLRGGMPSGHAAVAFSLWTIIVLISKSEIVIILSFIMALFIASSRLKNKVHNKWEVIAGSILGVLATLLCFQMLS
jgi:diacylglycerol kinase (ATP)